MSAHPKIAFEARLDGRALSWGSGQYCTDSVGQRAQARARSTCHHKTSEPALVLCKEDAAAFQSERIQRACPPIGPHGRTGTMPHMRRGDFDQTGHTYECFRCRTPHVRMQAMPRATSIHRRSREPNCSGDATLTGWSPQSNRSAENPGSYWPGFFVTSRQLAGRGVGACGFLCSRSTEPTAPEEAPCSLCSCLMLSLADIANEGGAETGNIGAFYSARNWVTEYYASPS